MNNAKKLHPQTLAIRGSKTQTQFKEHHQALFLTSSFMFDSAEECADVFAKRQAGYTYSRTNNPTVAAFQQRVAIIEVTLVSQTDANEWRKAIRPNTKMFFLETPSNPLGEVADIEALAQIAHEINALLVVDNCFCSPAVQQPLRLGADLSVQSGTKSIDGQGRVLGGIVCGKQDLITQIGMYVNTMGLSLSPFNAWMLLGGMETLMLRTDAAAASALKIAQWLQQQPQVGKVYYSGLPENPQAALVKKQQSTGGTVLAFEVKGDTAAAWKVIDNVNIFSKTANFGDVRSTIAHPWTTTHGRMPPEDKLAAGITEGLLRLSIGLEYTDDLIDDLAQALAA